MTAGKVVELSPVVRRVLAPNPGLMTGPGTNTYLVGRDEVAVIDPGPDDSEEHLDLVAAAGDGRIRWILVTHTHRDHSPGAAGLKARTGAEVLGFDERDGFVPDTAIGDGWVLDATGFRLCAIHTPGHASNHLCYRLEGERLLFSGDHIMSGSTVVIAPPDGDMAAYLAALERLKDLDLLGVAPGHGPYVEDALAVIEQYLSHRRARESAIEQALSRAGRARIPELVEAVYTDVPEALHDIARWSVWAHLRKLAVEGRAAARDLDDIDAEWWHPSR
jgi:glyoxylase-like metal-dependent hydrolase (beta-lactamase superfamily II)